MGLSQAGPGSTVVDDKVHVVQSGGGCVSRVGSSAMTSVSRTVGSGVMDHMYDLHLVVAPI